ncbi:5'-nucleotidase, lipoprotein e(P4) family [Aquimonas voraii]|uniref:Acid phosphatase n=1 Tax=Aquimonas voraii TaxID=265719 RepID=A0A1G6SZB0_9GAMM|nr:HAD family acid phosphatase [Aquimonas voraii]SDD22138.1 acid phosphatase [Aquimonas voraii]
MNFKPSILVLALASMLTACQSLPTQETSGASNPSGVPDALASPPADDRLNAVVWHQTSQEYRLSALGIYRAAERQLDRALSNPDWDALTHEDRDRPFAGLPPAVIVDVDETCLDNSPYQSRMLRQRRDFSALTWADWVREESAVPVPGALTFAKSANARGIRVFYISNRDHSLNASTLANLRTVGFPVENDDQFLGLGASLSGCVDVGSEKGCRRRLVGREYRVLLQVGDQIVDMVTVHDNSPSGRDAAVAPYLPWVGERWFVLPNPSYGSWESALYRDDRSLPQERRRAAKLDALRD